MDLLPRRVRFLLRRLNLRQPALLHRRHCGFEAPRQLRRAYRAVERLPACRQFRVVDGRACGKLLGFEHQRQRAGGGLEFPFPLRNAVLRLSQPRQRAVVAVALRLLAQCGEPGAHRRKRILCRRRRGSQPFDPRVQLALELHPQALFILLALEARLNRLARAFAAREARRVAVQVQRLPAAVEFYHRGEYRPGLGRQRFELRDDELGFGVLFAAVLDRLDALPREPGHAVVLVLGRVGELAQPVGRGHALGRRHARLRMLAVQGDIHQRGFIAHAGDSGAAALGIARVQRHFDPDRIGAPVRRELRLRARAVLRLRQRPAQRCGERRPHGGIGFFFPGGGKRSQVGTTLRGGDAHLRRRIGKQQLREFARVRRQRRDAEQALRRIGMLVQGGA